MPTAHILHGFRGYDDGKGSTDKLIEPLRDLGYQIKEWDYGYRGLLGVRFLNPRTAEKIAKEVKPGDIGVGHSNGCAILYRASQITKFNGMVFINPALDKDKAPNCDWFHTYYNAGDKAVWVAKWLLWHYWGEQGKTGYNGSHLGYTGFDGQNTIQMPFLDGHSDFFRYPEWIKFAAWKAMKQQDEAPKPLSP